LHFACIYVKLFKAGNTGIIGAKSMKIDRSRGIEKAKKFLSEYLATSDLQPGARLPSIKSLARQAHVSVVSMWKAMNLAKEERLLDGAPGHPFYLSKNSGDKGAVASAHDAESAPVQKWVQIKNSLQKSILSGEHKTLPSVKELCRQYDCSYPTIRKILEELARAGLVTAAKRGYESSLKTVSSSTSRIVLIAPGTQRGAGKTTWGGHNDEVVRQLEIACSRRNLKLSIILYSYTDEKLTFINYGTGDSASLSSKKDVLGYIMLMLDAGEGFFKIFQQICRQKKAVAVLDEVGKWAMPAFASDRKLARRFALGSTPRAGELAARYLLQLNHTKVAFLSVYQDASWVQQRLTGLSKTFAAAGYPDSVVPVTLGKRTIFENKASHEIRLAVEQALKKVIKTYSPEFVTNALTSSIDSLANELSFRDRLDAFMTAGFEQALKIKGATAWVCANDVICVAASAFLGKKRIAVPGKLSIVGFDDTVDAIHNLISSYNFNIPSIVELMLSHVLGMPLPFPASQDVIEIDGTVVERRSTGKAME
jgi:DNA-binding LacI/PurR family transcriptional regulator/DNA-binding transcriptional regulator YhcF (GntR family)